MQSIQSGDPIAPITSLHIAAVPEAACVVLRMEYITRNNQPISEAEPTLNYALKPELARTLARNLLDAADKADGKAAPQA